MEDMIPMGTVLEAEEELQVDKVVTFTTFKGRPTRGNISSSQSKHVVCIRLSNGPLQTFITKREGV